MKEVKIQLWVSTGGERGQVSRPCLVSYQLLPVGHGRLYEVLSIKDAHHSAEYPLENTLSLNGPMDPLIAAGNPAMVEFAKKELHTDITKPKKIKPKTFTPPSEPGQFNLPLP